MRESRPGCLLVRTMAWSKLSNHRGFALATGGEITRFSRAGLRASMPKNKTPQGGNVPR